MVQTEFLVAKNSPPKIFFEIQTSSLIISNTMAAIGSLVFCSDCGNLLPSTKGSEKNILSCECCGAENRGMILSTCYPPLA